MKQYRVFIDITVTKTFSISAESEEQAKEEALRQCRERSDYYARDNDGVVDVSVSDCEEDTEEDSTLEGMADALEFVREQIGCVARHLVRESVAKNMENRMPASDGIEHVADKIQDLLEEYGEDNDLPEGWWENEGDIDDWLMEL